MDDESQKNQRSVATREEREPINDYRKLYLYLLLIFMTTVTITGLGLLCHLAFPQCYTGGASHSDGSDHLPPFSVNLNIPVSVNSVARVDGLNANGSGETSEVVTMVSSDVDPLSDEFIEEINRKATTWKAGRNFRSGSKLAKVRNLVNSYSKGLSNIQEVQLPERRYSAEETMQNDELPKTFDGRTAWPHCPSLRQIRDEGSCNSGWAQNTAAMMTDRECILNNRLFHYSGMDLITCCDDCKDGCYRGSAAKALKYWKEVGVVSGGPYDSNQGCKPYGYETCVHSMPGERSECDFPEYETPACTNTCNSSSYNISYSDDLHKAKEVYTILSEYFVLKELITSGPIVAEMALFDDFYHYKSGVYIYTDGNYLGTQAVKIIGYGEEQGVPYFLCANSWNYDWGEGGFAKIARSEFNIMSEKRFAGIPVPASNN